MEIKQEKVLVTGASGYIALHCISELLKKGYKVKGSLRDMSKEQIIRKYFVYDIEKLLLGSVIYTFFALFLEDNF